MKRLCALLIVTSAWIGAAHATTWYVRTDGGTRYSSLQTAGQCNGMYDAPYSGSGVNQNCAFNDVRYFWTDSSYTTSTNNFPAWGWIGSGGDTYIIEGTIAQGVSWRVGQQTSAANGGFGLYGNNQAAGAPPPPSGTPSAHTHIFGVMHAMCTGQSARTQLHGGFGVGAVLDLGGSSYVDVACLDITDWSSCGVQGQANGCSRNAPYSDYAGSGVQFQNTSTYDTLTDVRIHGLANAGILGATGTGVVLTDVQLIGNSESGWNADDGSGQTGTGTLLVQSFQIEWNGCAEEYPIVDAQPYQDCADDSTSAGNGPGYGDGFGTATAASSPGWQAHFDNGIVAYNTQDGLDALHLTGTGSSMTITHVLSYGNMGNQIKIGGTSGTADSNIIIGNCNALRQAIPGTPSGYNTNLSDFCRAGDASVALLIGPGETTTFANNTILSASATAVEVDCNGGPGNCNTTSLMKYENNIFIGFLNNTADGYPNGGNGSYSNPIYETDGSFALSYPGSVWRNNIYFHPAASWTCPGSGETNSLCADPKITDEVFHLYSYDNPVLLAGSPAIHAGTPISGLTADFAGNAYASPPSMGAFEYIGTVVGSAVRGFFGVLGLAGVRL